MNRAPGDSQFHSSNSQDSPRFQEPYNIFQFYNSDGPWIPQGVIQPADTLNSSSRPSAYNSGAPSFHGYRSTGLPSDCGTAPDDSGYGGTRSAYSFAESVAGNDRCAENAYLETTADQMIGDLTINQIYPPSQMQHHQASTVEFLCNHCGHSCKTKSELKKHSARHEKPYKCTYETCTKAKQGFSTPNDLARHKKTVHREHNENDPIYICHHGGCSRKKEKLWPRADNFRSHLSRSHNINLKADSDLGEYRHKPNTAKPLGRIQDKTRSTAQVNPGHRPMQLQDAPPVYTCPHHTCPQAKGKTWPTADDLRAHLSHDHNLQLDADLKGYHFQLEATEAHTLRGVGSSIADVDPEPRPAQLQDSPDLRGDQVSTTASGQVQNESSKQSDLPLTQTCLTSGDRPPQMRSSILDALKISSVPGSDTLASQPLVDLTCADDVSLGESEAMLPHDEVTSEPFDHEGDDIIEDEEILDRQEPLMLQITSPTASVQLKADSPQDGITEALIATQTSGQVFEASTEAPPADTPTFEPCKASGLFPLLDNVPTGQILSFLRNIPKDLLEKALKPEDPSASGNDNSSDPGEHQKAEIICPECRKAFSRNCELRKHMKRHDKPYGCTYKTCCKKFGSKNDWKRHESSQHFQLESWNCNLDGCDKVLPRRELFKWHLINHHKVQDSQKIDKLQEECRLGRHCDPRFWCGFCDKFVEITGEVVNSWTKRCDHIDSHLFGKDGLEKKNMLQWHYLEDKLAEGAPEAKLAESSSRASKKRKATEDVSSRPSKRTNFNSFKCCNCGNVESYHTCASCQECQHQRCGHCKIEGTVVPDDDDTEMVNMN